MDLLDIYWKASHTPTDQQSRLNELAQGIISGEDEDPDSLLEFGFDGGSLQERQVRLGISRAHAI